MKSKYKNHFYRSVVIALLICCLIYVSCGKAQKRLINEADLTVTIGYENFFDYDDDEAMRKANWANGGFFGCDFADENVDISDGIMTLSLTGTRNYDKYNLNFSGAEYRTNQSFGYGLYSVVMKPAQNDGIVSSFFTYTKSEDGSDWDEIDIEFLGRDANVVQFNYFVDGVGDHEFIYDLGFDATEDFHEYGFLWTQEGITWFVDGMGVYFVDGTQTPIPDTPGKIMMNLWNGVDAENINAWLNKYDGNVDLYAYYDSFYYATVDEINR